MLRLGICDDERECSSVLEKCIGEYLKGKNIPYEISVYSSGEKLLELNEQVTEFDAIFLDVNMGQMDGIETAQRIREYSEKVQLVFVTAFVDYSLEGYKVNAVRYLLKNTANFEQQIYECMQEVVKRTNYVEEKMTFPFVGGDQELKLDNIVYIESVAHKLIFHVLGHENTVYTLYSKLGDIEEMLKDYSFIRIHQSYIVNFRYIKSMSEKGVDLTVWDKNLAVSRERYANARRKYILLKGAF